MSGRFADWRKNIELFIEEKLVSIRKGSPCIRSFFLSSAWCESCGWWTGWTTAPGRHWRISICTATATDYSSGCSSGSSSAHVRERCGILGEIFLGRSKDNRFQSTTVFCSPLTTHEIIDKRIDSRICITQPVGEQRENGNHFALIQVRVRVAYDAQSVNREVASGEHYHDGYQHFRRLPSGAQLSHRGGVRFAVTHVIDFICAGDRQLEKRVRISIGI